MPEQADVFAPPGDVFHNLGDGQLPQKQLDEASISYEQL
jgi:hypothetical protein